MRKDIIKIVVSTIFLMSALFINVTWIKIGLFLISYIVVAYEVLLEALENIAKGEIFSEEFLMCIASIGAFIMGEYPEAIAVMLFFQVGEMFEEYAEDKSRASIQDLMNIKPEYANVKQGNEEIRKMPNEVKVGEIIIIKPGEKVPLDGKVISGEAFIDTSALTGEAVPRKVYAGKDILSGSINTNGVLEVEVTKEFGESTVSKILNLVENASNKKAHTEKFITKFAKIYTPVVIISAFFIAIIPTLIFKQDFLTWIYRALTFLVVSCPCALVVSVPLSFFGGIGGASKKGILIKGSSYLEKLSKASIVIFDKTGTLTKGTFTVQNISSVSLKENELLEIAAYIEEYSNHPIACSIKKAYNGKIDKNRVSHVEEISGNGISAILDGKKVYVGNEKLMKKIGISIKQEQIAGTIVYIAIENEYMGKIVIADEIKEDAKKTILDLKKQGIKQTVMLTGDLKQVANLVGKEIGIDTVFSELLPTDKVKKVEQIMKDREENVVFVGDGLNDAPVLVTADVGIAMGAYGTDAAIEAADAVIMTDEPSKVLAAIKIAKKTMRIAKQNIIFAIGVKLLVLILSFFGVATMWEAVFADVGVTVIAVLNSFRTLRK